MIWGLLIYVFNFWNFRGSFWSLIFGFWKFLKCILNQNSYFWGGVCFMNFLIWGFLNDFINSSGIIFEFHYNFIIFFCVWVPRFYTKNFNFFLPPIPPKKWLFWQNLAILALFGTFWIFFDHLYPPKKTKKILYWHNFAILAFFGTFGIFFTPYAPKKPKKWLFWQNVAILALFSTFLGGGQNCPKKDNVI